MVGGDDGDVVDFGEAEEVVDVFVEFLLAFGEHAAAEVFGAEVADEAVDDEEFDVLELGVVLDLLDEEHLVVAVVGAADDDVFEGFGGGEFFGLGHVDDAFGAEGAFRVDVGGFGVAAAVFGGELDVDAELVAELGFAGAEGAGEFGHGAGFDAAAEEGVEFAAVGGDAFDGLSFLPELIGSFKTNTGKALSGFDDLLGGAGADTSEAGEFFDGSCGDAFDGAEAAFFKFLGDGWSDAINLFQF